MGFDEDGGGAAGSSEPTEVLRVQRPTSYGRWEGRFSGMESREVLGRYCDGEQGAFHVFPACCFLPAWLNKNFDWRGDWGVFWD